MMMHFYFPRDKIPHLSQFHTFHKTRRPVTYFVRPLTMLCQVHNWDKYRTITQLAFCSAARELLHMDFAVRSRGRKSGDFERSRRDGSRATAGRAKNRQSA